jgi:hypothetical protein
MTFLSVPMITFFSKNGFAVSEILANHVFEDQRAQENEQATSPAVHDSHEHNDPRTAKAMTIVLLLTIQPESR